MPSLDARRHTIDDGGDTPTRAGVYAALLTVRDPIPVANTTDRAQVLADLAAKGIVPDTDEPVFFFRADAGAGRELEYTVDGTDFRTIPALETAWAAFTYQNTWSTFPNSAYGTPGYRRLADGLVVLRGLVAPGGTTDATVIAALPAGFRPAADRYFTNVAFGATAHIVVASNGEIRYRTGSGTPNFMCLDMIRFVAEQ